MLKSTGSSFEGFVRDEFTTLPEASDRILSTSVDLTYDFPPHTLRDAEEIGQMGTLFNVGAAATAARETTLRVFCEDSASVQVRDCDIGRCRSRRSAGDVVRYGTGAARRT